MHKYHLLAGISTILAISSITLVFFYLPSKTVLYALLVLPTLSLPHHIFVFLAVPFPIAGPSSQIEKSTFNLLLLALLTVLAIATGGAAWLFIVLHSGSSTTHTPQHNHGFMELLYIAPASALSSLAPEREQSSPAAIWILQGGVLLAQAIVLASMFSIVARESRISTMASWRGCAYECARTGSDIEHLMCIKESRSEIDTVTVPGNDEEEKRGCSIIVEE